MKSVSCVGLWVFLCALASGCGKSATTGSMVELDHPEFLFSLPDGGSREWLGPIHDALMADRQRITGHLQVSAMPKITVSVWAGSAEFYDAMQGNLGQVYQGATGYLNGPREICLLHGSRTPGEAVHEFAHAVSLALNPRFGNNPRWLWEAVAIYEAREVTDASTWPNEAKRFPGFASLNQYNSALPYQWGYTIGRFIVTRYGDLGYVDLIRSNGDVQTTLGVSESEFGSLIEAFIGRQ